jgi:hypothetical protein
MKNLVSKIKEFSQEVTYESLKRFIDGIDFSTLDYQNDIPEPATEGDYGRNEFTMDPFECVLVNWPAGIESGVHHHKGLFGYVVVLEGELINILFKEEE